MIKKIYLAALLLCGSTNLIAGPYVGGGLGTVDVGDDISTFEDSTGFELIIGNKISNSFSFEASFIDFGEAGDNIAPEWTITADSLTFGGLLTAPANTNLDLFFKFGLHLWDVSLSEAGFGTFAEDDGTDIFYGFGANFKASNDLGIGARFSTYDFDGIDITMLSVNLQVAF